MIPKEFEDNQLDLCNKSNIKKLPIMESYWIIGRVGNCSATTKVILYLRIRHMWHKNWGLSF